ncbi:MULTISPECIES: acetyl-CoA C-acyltransferase [unclassified Sphingobium]|uniref:acetyl-CoA C-acyltransferase n=1 Tax=unclassified Sphingobium TaxID=2611147 RepID=UPI00159BFF2A|nr:MULTISPECIES: acetyl-CoA C-acyltransferase [unclassified Sphingobium]
MNDQIVIVGAARTPMAGLQGDFASLSAYQLGAEAIRAAVGRAGVPAGDVEGAIMGCVLPAGQGQAPARQAALGAGLPESAGCSTVNKMCGSGMQAIMFAYDMLVADNAQVLVAGGMESMTNSPYLLPKARAGLRLGHGAVVDHMFLDGLEDAYDRGRLMGTFAEDAAQVYGFTRAEQDSYALASLERALNATRDGSFTAEITPVAVETRKGRVVISVDEQPGKARPENIPTLKPAFRDGGTVTAANSSSISDGAAAVVMMALCEAEKRGSAPLARVVGHATWASTPSQFASAPVGAIRRLLGKVGWAVDDVDLWEINEAFAIVALIVMRELGLPHEKVNVHGGACALGHPIGASGARVVVTLTEALRKHGLKRGIATLCIGGGEATALAVEIL